MEVDPSVRLPTGTFKNGQGEHIGGSREAVGSKPPSLGEASAVVRVRSKESQADVEVLASRY